MVSLPEFLEINPLTNALRRMRSRRAFRLNRAASSQDYWSREHVDAPSAGFRSVGVSLSHYRWRNAMYPGCIELMPTSGADGLSVLDYGCGPGNDLIGFGHYSKLAALHAADVSVRSVAMAKTRADLHAIPVTFHLINEATSTVDLPDRSIDLIHCAGVLHHLPDPTLAL